MLSATKSRNMSTSNQTPNKRVITEISILDTSISKVPIPSQKQCRLRILHCNDVYDISAYPYFKTARDMYFEQAKSDPNGEYPIYAVLAGDFLAPSLLSSLDYGRAVVDVMNSSGIDYVCFGNHECDVPHVELLKRLAESKFTWINSNMQSLDLRGTVPKLPQHIIHTVTSPDGSSTKKIAFLGLLTHDRHLYREDSWDGATIDEVIPTYKDLVKLLMEGPTKVDLVIPFTHQSIKHDRKMARICSNLPEFDILEADNNIVNVTDKVDNILPIIIGGHDHDLYYEKIKGTEIIKVGADLDNFSVIDIIFPLEDNKDNNNQNIHDNDIQVHIAVERNIKKRYKPDEEVFVIVKEHLKVLEQLQEAALCLIPKNTQLSSEGIRLKQTSVGTMLVSAMRDYFLADGALFNSGGIRANKTYPRGTTMFTYADLEAEMPFDNGLVLVEMPGRVVNEIVKFSRKGAYLNPSVESGGFMQVDDGMVWCEETQEITHVNHKLIQPDKLYKIVVVEIHLRGIDNVTPMVKWAEANAESIEHDSIPVKVILVRYFSRAIWMNLGSFAQIDFDADGRISRAELKNFCEKNLKLKIGDFVADKIFDEVDMNQDGYINESEMLSAVLHAGFTSFDWDHDGVLERSEIKLFLEQALGHPVPEAAVTDVFHTYGLKPNDCLTRDIVRNRVMKNRFGDKKYMQ